VLPGIKVPVCVKGVGHGIERKWVEKFQQAGVRAVDVSGTGGTSWAWIEGRRQVYNEETNLGYLLRDVGIPTDVCLRECKSLAVAPSGVTADQAAKLGYGQLGSDAIELVAGGGIRTGVDIAKALTMGATHVTAAMPFLSAALDSSDAVRAVIQRLKRELQAAMFACGAKSIDELRSMRPPSTYSNL
jgi:isopentenyl-diphosphate delta-isomerase